MFNALSNRVSHAARKAGLLTGGLLCATVGGAFLTLAAWIYLSAEQGAQAAALIIGAAYFGIGMLILAVASSSSGSGQSSAHTKPQAAATRPREAVDPDAPPIMQAFLYGLQAGISSETRRGS